MLCKTLLFPLGKGGAGGGGGGGWVGGEGGGGGGGGGGVGGGEWISQNTYASTPQRKLKHVHTLKRSRTCLVQHILYDTSQTVDLAVAGAGAALPTRARPR